MAISSDGTTALIGAPAAGTSYTGAAYVFHASAEGAWASSSTPTATLTNGSGSSEDSLGYSVAISSDGTTALIGADGVNGYTGAAYVFHTSAESSWASRSTPTATLTNGSGSQYDYLGHSVAISSDGTTALIGADGVNSSTGAAYVFHASAEGSWASSSTPTATLTNGSGAPNDYFGHSVALSSDGTTALIGAYGANGANKGAVYVFSAPGGAPTVTSLVPNAGPTTGGTTVTIDGTNFAPTSTVKFGSVAASSVTFVSSTELKAVAPAEASEVVNVTVTTNGATSASSIHSLYAYGPPTLSSFSPASGITGSTVTINGANYVPGMTVKFGTLVSPSVTFVSTIEIKAVVPNGAVVGKISVADNAGSASSSTTFTPTLAITGFSPTGGPSGTVVTITGIGFSSSSQASFNGKAATTTFVSSSELKATVPATATSGPISVTNTTAPIGTVRSAADFTALSVTGLVPNAGPTAGGTTVVIKGSGLVSGASVKFGSTASASVTFVSSTELKAVGPAHAIGVVGVRVTTPAGTSANTSADLYAYGPPTLSSFSPPSGITGSTVTINGANYVPGMTVKFGTLVSPSVTFVSTTEIKAAVPNGAAAGKISVADNAGSASSSTNFTPTLAITGFSPTSGPAGKVVTITGIGFNSSSLAKFNGSAAATTFVSSSQLKATVPAAATTGPISVTNTTAPIGTVRSAGNYTVT